MLQKCQEEIVYLAKSITGFDIKGGTSMYRRILTATDGSENASQAIETAAKLAAMVNADKLDIVHVVQHPATLMSGGEGAAYVMIEQLFEELKADGSRILESAAALARRHFDGNVETHLLVGTPAEEIIDMSRKGDHDLIVLGRRGLNRIERLFLGSVSGRLTQQARCSVLVVKDPNDGR